MGRRAGVTAGETRQQLVDAAASVFAEQGYEGATIADIARRAGLSSGAIYAHYRSKAELLAEAVRAQSSSEVAGMLAADADRDLSMTDILVALGDRLARRTGSRRSLLLEAASAARRDPEVAAALAAEVGDGEDRFAEMLRCAQANGAVGARYSPEVIARLSLMLGMGSLVVDALGLAPVDEDEWHDFMAGLVHGFRPPPSRPAPPARRATRPRTARPLQGDRP
jgi:AcrR family transcriptional regulator